MAPQIRALRKGFTLVELMIVIAIIGILAAIAIPVYTGWVCRSQQEEGIVALEQLITGYRVFAARNGSYKGAKTSGDIGVTINEPRRYTYALTNGTAEWYIAASVNNDGTYGAKLLNCSGVCGVATATDTTVTLYACSNCDGDTALDCVMISEKTAPGSFADDCAN